MKFSKTLAAAAAIVALSGAAQAALIDRGGGMIYDTTLKITWLADMNYAVTSGYAAENEGGTERNVIQADGGMGWDAAVAWADQLYYGGFSDWRLPTINVSDTTCSKNSRGQYFGYHCTGGELSHLFVTDLGNKADESVLIQTEDTVEQIANLALFTNVQSYLYWTGMESTKRTSWYFATSVAYQGVDYKEEAAYAVAVRPGDVTAAVPEPQTLALALVALGATVVARRRRPF